MAVTTDEAGPRLAPRREIAARVLIGTARGIDSLTHQGACRAPDGAPGGVLGTGVDVLNPKENKKIFAEVEKRRP